MSTFFHWLCSPIAHLVLLVAAALALRVLRRSRSSAIVLMVAVGWTLLVSSTPLSQVLIYLLERQYSPVTQLIPGTKRPEYVLILGGGHTNSPQLPASTQLSATAVVRLVEGVRLVKQWPGGKLVCSGYSASRQTTHAEMLARAALELGIDITDTLQLRNSSKTDEEIKAFKARFGDAPFFLVTSARHMPRAMLICRREGILAIPAPTDFLLKEDPKGQRFEFYPSVQKMVFMEVALHEYAGMLKIFLLG